MTVKPRCTRTVVFLCPFLRKGFKEDDTELKDTVKGMMSDDCKERMAAEKAEYQNLKAKINQAVRQGLSARPPPNEALSSPVLSKVRK